MDNLQMGDIDSTCAHGCRCEPRRRIAGQRSKTAHHAFCVEFPLHLAKLVHDTPVSGNISSTGLQKVNARSKSFENLQNTFAQTVFTEVFDRNRAAHADINIENILQAEH